MTTLVPPLLIVTAHGTLLRDWQTVPRVGDLIELPWADDDGQCDQPHRVVGVAWSDAAVTIECECEEGPDE